MNTPTKNSKDNFIAQKVNRNDTVIQLCSFVSVIKYDAMYKCALDHQNVDIDCINNRSRDASIPSH